MHAAQTPTNLSTRHMPDTSNASFQIPSFHGSALLSEETWDLGIDAFDDDDSGLDHDPFTTPLHIASKRTIHAPLTLSELTPRERECSAGMADHAQPQQQRDPTSSRKINRGKEMEWQDERQTSVRHTLPQKESVDDMFERRKRDNYQQMGIDLSSKSTARMRHDVEDVIQPCSDPDESTQPRGSNPPTQFNTMTSESHISDTRKTIHKPKPKRTVLDKDAGIAKHKPRVTTQPKSILKSSKPVSRLPPSSLTRSLTAASQSPQAERPRWGDSAAEGQHASQRRDSSGSGIAAIGGGLIDVLVKCGEKLRGSFGFSSSVSMTSTPRASAVSAGSQLSTSVPRDTSMLDGEPTHAAHGTAAGSSSKSLTLSDLLPSQPNRHHDALTLSDLSPSKQIPPADDIGPEQPSNTLPMRPSKKRALNGAPTRGSKKGKLVSDAAPSTSSSQTSSKHSKNGPAGTAAVKGISKPMPLAPLRTANNVPTQLRQRSQSISAAKGGHHLGTETSAQDLKGRSHGKSAATTRSRRGTGKEQHPPVNLTAPSGPVFASDVYRQLALDKTQKEHDRRDANEREKKNFKVGTMPHFSKPAPPARPAIRPTIPAAFTFHSEARAAQRNAEFEEKRKTWESHTMRQTAPIPDFAAMHAAQAEAARSRRVVPVLPTAAPVLTTMARAKEREKFDVERKERERDMERQLAIRDKERAEQEEREYKEARKRTVPKAHEVPEWYKDLRKRKEIT